VNRINSRVVWRDSVRVVDRDVVVQGELSVKLHPFDEQGDIVELVRLQALEHVRKPPELVTMQEELFVAKLERVSNEQPIMRLTDTCVLSY